LTYSLNEYNEKVWTCKFDINDIGNRVFKLISDGKDSGANATVTVIKNTGSFSPTLQQNPIRVILEGKEVEFDVPPQIINGRTMLPVRAIFEALGATVKWDPEPQNITAEKWNDSTQGIMVTIFWVGRTEMYSAWRSLFIARKD